MSHSSGPASDRGASYRDIAAELAKEIESGAIAGGAFLPTEKDLQRRFGVSRTTVRRALQKLTVDGIAESIPNRGVVASRLGRAGARSIAFIDGYTIVLRRIYARLSSSFLQRGFHLVHIDSEAIGLENALRYATEQKFAGAMVWSFQGFAELPVVHAAAERMPIVILDHAIPGFEADIVSLDYFNMAREVVGELARSGRRQIGVTGMLDMLDITHQRFSGYMQGLFENDLNPSPRDFVFCRTSGPNLTDTHLLELRLQEPDRPDALFVMQDQWVPNIVDAVHRCGLRIPEDIALATIGDDVQVSVGGTGISAAHCDWDEFADLALDTLLDRMTGAQGPPRRLLASHKLERCEPNVSGEAVAAVHGAATVTVRKH